jgi:hypothetical protein
MTTDEHAAQDEVTEKIARAMHLSARTKYLALPPEERAREDADERSDFKRAHSAFAWEETPAAWRENLRDHVRLVREAIDDAGYRLAVGRVGEMRTQLQEQCDALAITLIRRFCL